MVDNIHEFGFNFNNDILNNANIFGSSKRGYQAQLSSTIFLQELFKNFGLRTPAAGGIEANKLRSLAPTTEGFRAQAVAKTLGTSGNDFIDIVKRLNLQEKAYLNLINPLKADSAAASKVADFLRVFGQSDQKVFDTIKNELEPAQQLEMKRDLETYVLATGANVDALQEYAQSYTPKFILGYPGIVGLKPGARAAANLGATSPILSVQLANRKKLLLDDLQKRGDFNEDTIKIAKSELDKVGVSNDALDKLNDRLVQNGEKWGDVLGDKEFTKGLIKSGYKPGGQQYSRGIRFAQEIYRTLAYTSSQGLLHGGARAALGALTGGILPETGALAALAAGGIAFGAASNFNTQSAIAASFGAGGAGIFGGTGGASALLGISPTQLTLGAYQLGAGTQSGDDITRLVAANKYIQDITGQNFTGKLTQLEQMGYSKDAATRMALMLGGDSKVAGLLQYSIQAHALLSPMAMAVNLRGLAQNPQYASLYPMFASIMNSGVGLKRLQAITHLSQTQLLQNPNAGIDALVQESSKLMQQNGGDLGVTAATLSGMYGANIAPGQITTLAGITPTGSFAQQASANQAFMQSETNAGALNILRQRRQVDFGIKGGFGLLSEIGILNNPDISPIPTPKNMQEALNPAFFFWSAFQGLKNQFQGNEAYAGQAQQAFQTQQAVDAQRQIANNTSNLTSGPLAVNRNSQATSIQPVATPVSNVSR